MYYLWQVLELGHASPYIYSYIQAQLGLLYDRFKKLNGITNYFLYIYKRNYCCFITKYLYLYYLQYDFIQKSFKTSCFSFYLEKITRVWSTRHKSHRDTDVSRPEYASQAVAGVLQRGTGQDSGFYSLLRNVRRNKKKKTIQIVKYVTTYFMVQNSRQTIQPLQRKFTIYVEKGTI